MNRFLRLLHESVIVQGIVTIALVGTSCYLFATGREVPVALLALDNLTVGFFFGSKVQAAMLR